MKEILWISKAEWEYERRWFIYRSWGMSFMRIITLLEHSNIAIPYRYNTHLIKYSTWQFTLVQDIIKKTPEHKLMGSKKLILL
jgi:hypothetical protein